MARLQAAHARLARQYERRRGSPARRSIGAGLPSSFANSPTASTSSGLRIAKCWFSHGTRTNDE
eukprot:4023670-Prymnesium_polylepis.1